jgi:hypothetical protein
MELILKKIAHCTPWHERCYLGEMTEWNEKYVLEKWKITEFENM